MPLHAIYIIYMYIMPKGITRISNNRESTSNSTYSCFSIAARVVPTTELASNKLYVKQQAQEASPGGGTTFDTGTLSMKADKLSVDNTFEIFEIMYEARNKWHNIGGVFRVPESTLQCIAVEETDNEGKLRRVIIAWLKRYGGTEHCSWNVVVSALQNKTIDRDDIARKLCEKYLPKCNSPSVSSTQSHDDGSAHAASHQQFPHPSSFQDDKTTEPVKSKLPCQLILNIKASYLLAQTNPVRIHGVGTLWFHYCE